jgi:MFS family permease
MRYWLLLIFVFLLPIGGAVAAPDMPALMLLIGEIAPGEGVATTAVREQDRVLAFSVADGQLVGVGVLSGPSYAISLIRTASFNGMPVVLELQQGRKRFALLRADGSPAMLRFAGRTLPERTILPLKVGALTAELAAAEAADPQAQRLSLRADLPCTPEADVNHDGVCDAADLRILRLYGGGVTRTVGRP